MELYSLKDFSLVDGTALALKYGHRVSIDLDLFTNQEFNKEYILSELKQTFGNKLLYENSRIDWAFFCFINNIKVDILQYKHPQIEKTKEHDGFRLYSNLDLIAMKIMQF